VSAAAAAVEEEKFIRLEQEHEQILQTWKNDCVAELLGDIMRTTKHLGGN
jgi:hypothetical protein